MEMANYILSIFKTNVFVVWSWGFNCPVAVENGLMFNVQGYKHTGKVEILYNEGKDLFEVKIINRDGTIRESIEDVYFDQLIDIIDNRVELTEDYKSKVEETYPIENEL